MFCAIQVGNVYEFKLGFQKLNQNYNVFTVCKYYNSTLKRETLKEVTLMFEAVWTKKNTLLAGGS
jgi:hypothetical protein